MIHMVIGVVGMPGAGKSTLTQHFKGMRFPIIRFGQFVIDEVMRRGIEVNAENERVVREEIRRSEGMDVWAQRSLPLIRAHLEKNPVVLLDGLYSWSEYKTLRSALEVGFVLIAVVAARAKRYERLQRRPHRPLTLSEAETRDIAEIEEIEKGGPIAIADYTVLNDGSEAGLFQAGDQILQALLHGR